MNFDPIMSGKLAKKDSVSLSKMFNIMKRNGIKAADEGKGSQLRR